MSSTYLDEKSYQYHEQRHDGEHWEWIDCDDGNRCCSICGWLDPHGYLWTEQKEERPTLLELQNMQRLTANRKARAWWLRGSGRGRNSDEFYQRSVLGRGVRAAFRAAGMRITSTGHILTRGEQDGRYKPKFHLNERIAQWSMADPAIPKDDWNHLRAKAETGEFGPTSRFSRATVIELLKDCDMCKYRERWKSILHKLNPELELKFPSPGVIEVIERVFDSVLREFRELKHTMPQSMSKGADGVMKLHPRKNFLSYNYVCRKILESLDIWEWHSEFPIPISCAKLKALDDVMAEICKRIGLPFMYTVIMRRPKYKRSKKEKEALLHRAKKLTHEDKRLMKFIEAQMDPRLAEGKSQDLDWDMEEFESWQRQHKLFLEAEEEEEEIRKMEGKFGWKKKEEEEKKKEEEEKKKEEEEEEIQNV